MELYYEMNGWMDGWVEQQERPREKDETQKKRGSNKLIKVPFLSSS